jgi:hypothetical protein
MHTPWGAADTVRTIADGIKKVSTPSHGGFFVSPERMVDMPAGLAAIQPFAGKNWYEEDEDWAIVALAFPEHFSGFELLCAVDTVTRGADPQTRVHEARRWLDGDPKGMEVLESAEAYRAQKADLMRITSASTSGKSWNVRAVNLTRTYALVLEFPGDSLDRLGEPFSEEDVVVAGGSILKRQTSEPKAPALCSVPRP